MSKTRTTRDEYVVRENTSGQFRTKGKAATTNVPQPSHRPARTWNDVAEQVLNDRDDLWKRLADR